MSRAPSATVQRYLPWLVGVVLFMETLDSTIVNTAVPAMARSLDVTPLSLKAIVASYILALAIGIPVSGWLADRFGTRKVFTVAVALFTVASVMCGLAVNAPMLIVSRVLQGVGAAMMTPVGRLAIVRTFPRSELLSKMNFVIIPALIGPLLGPTLGGLIVHWWSWREIFFVNVPVGLAALWLMRHCMPDYRSDSPRNLDVVGLVLFCSGAALLSWLLEVFGEHRFNAAENTLLLLVSLGLLGAYALHAFRTEHPLLNLRLFKVRTFRVSVGGGLITRLGISGLPFLLPLFYQLGLGMPAWQSGLMMMPSALAAMVVKAAAPHLLRRFGYRRVLTTNTVMMGVTIGLFALVDQNTPLVAIVALSFLVGSGNSVQFSSMNSLAFADVDDRNSSMANTIASSMQQLSMGFGLACGSLLAGWYLGNLPQTDQDAVIGALHSAFITLGVGTMLSSLTYWTLRPGDGHALTGKPEAPVAARESVAN